MAVRALPRAITSCATSLNDSPNSFDIARTTSAFSATNHATHRLATTLGAERVRPRSHYALHGLPCISLGQMSINVRQGRKPSEATARQILNRQLTFMRQMERLYATYAIQSGLYNQGSLAVDFSFLSISHKHGQTRNTNGNLQGNMRYVCPLSKV